MAAKTGRKTIFANSHQYTLQIPCESKISSKSLISLRFRDKLIFAFNTEIQDGHQKWRENDFCKKSPVDSVDTLRVKNFVQIALSHSVSEFLNAFLHLTQKFKMAAKSGRKIFFKKNLPVHSAATLWVKNFVEISLSRSVSEISGFLHFTQKFKMAAKSGRKQFVGKVTSRHCRYPVGQNFC